MDTLDFWAGSFGDDYTERNVGRVNNNIALFSGISVFMKKPESVIEFGAGSGENIQAMEYVWPDALYSAVEINANACRRLSDLDHVIISHGSIYDADLLPADLVLTKGLLIHIPPERIAEAYDQIYSHAKRYILMCEYYNPTLVAVPYRGHAGKLWKRDFAGEMLDRYGDLRLVEYGFVYRRDGLPQDDITWFLLEKYC